MSTKGNQNAKGNKGGGRPTAYSPSMVPMLEKACKAGFTDAEIAQLLGVCERTINTWKVEHPEFSAALKDWKDEADTAVERSLYERAMGYEHDDVDIRTVALGGDAGSQIVQTPIRKKYPPDATSMIFWLKNRQPAKWRDKVDVEHSGSIDLADRLANARKRATV